MFSIISLLYICIFTSCAPLNNHVEAKTNDDLILLGKQDGTYGNEDSVLSDLVLTSRSEQVFDKFYNCEDVNVRLDIVLHIFYYVSMGESGERKYHIYTPVSINDIIEDVEYAESVYDSLNLKFQISSVSAIIIKIDVDNDEDFSFELAKRVIYNTYEDNHMFLLESSNNIDSISVFYTISIGDGISGLSIFPWNKNPYGIQIVRNAARKYVFAHEIGHYFGLYHTFHDPTDLVEDTPYKNLTMDEVGTDKDPNQYNIMSYPNASSDNLYLTRDQIARVKAFLTISRNSHVILEEDTDFVLLENIMSNKGRLDFLIEQKELIVHKLIEMDIDISENKDNDVKDEATEDVMIDLGATKGSNKCCDHSH